MRQLKHFHFYFSFQKGMISSRELISLGKGYNA